MRIPKMKLTGWKRNVMIFLIASLGTAAFMVTALLVLPGGWGITVVWLLPFALIVIRLLMDAYRLSEDYLARWTKSHKIVIDDENRAVIRRYLLHGRRIRTTGALCGLVGHAIYTTTQATSKPPFGWITATFGGYLLGAAAAEIWALRPQRGTVRAASLAPRRTTDYVPRLAVLFTRIVPVMTVAVLIYAPFMKYEFGPGLEFEGADATRTWGPLIGWTIASVVLAFLVEMTARRIVRRPQPITSEKLLEADDAIRSTSLHCLIGAGLALMLYALSRNLSEILSFHAYGPNGVRAVFTSIMFISGIFVPFVWLRFGIDQPWVVRRSRKIEPVAA